MRNCPCGPGDFDSPHPAHGLSIRLKTPRHLSGELEPKTRRSALNSEKPMTHACYQNSCTRPLCLAGQQQIKFSQLFLEHAERESNRHQVPSRSVFVCTLAALGRRVSTNGLLAGRNGQARTLPGQTPSDAHAAIPDSKWNLQPHFSGFGTARQPAPTNNTSPAAKGQ